jgi:ABC-type cobalamin/Fe3+-siderophores transport system ATPase subunit
MIRKVVITDPTKCCVPWWKDVPWLKGKTEITFQPGLNVLFGPNGSGKTTLLTLLARSLCCEQGNVQKVTQDALHHLVPLSLRSEVEYNNGVLPDHDGGPVLHFDPSKAVGLCHGSFDYDFMIQGVVNVTTHVSAGQTTLHRIDDILGAIIEDKWPALDVHEGRHGDRLPEWFATFLRGTGEKGPPTVLLDEPSRSLDVGREIRLLEILSLVAPRVQIIMASHSLFSLLMLPDAHFIDTEPGYSQAARNQIEFRAVDAIRKQDPTKLRRMEEALDKQPISVKPLPSPRHDQAKLTKVKKKGFRS